MIPVTKSYIPPIEEYTTILNRSFSNGWLTNRGELVLELEQKIHKKLNLKQTKILNLNNGTIPLQIALKLLGKGGEVLTTPFSYVATTSSILWEGCTPVFVDIHPDYLTIDESKIEELITDKTSCILATHVYGNPCNVDAIDIIAKKYNLKVIYDASHCFGVEFKGNSVFEYGDISTCSFHATKIFHTGEGGAIFCKDDELFQKIFYSHNFGHNGPHDFYGVGINGKMSEIHASMGLVMLNHIDDIISKRKKIFENYKIILNSEKISFLKLREFTSWNYSYLPIVFQTEELMLDVLINLNKQDIFPRRYFYPSLNTLDFIENKNVCLNSESVSSRVLCLPLYIGLTESEISKICNIIIQSLNKNG